MFLVSAPKLWLVSVSRLPNIDLEAFPCETEVLLVNNGSYETEEITESKVMCRYVRCMKAF